MFKLPRDFAGEEFFFLRVASRKKGRKIKYRRAIQDSPLSFFVLQVAQVKTAKDFYANELHTRAVQVRETKEAVESTKAGLLPQEGDVKKERRKIPRKVVCRHKKGT
jgi:hypothetical protein